MVQVNVQDTHFITQNVGLNGFRFRFVRTQWILAFCPLFKTYEF